MIEVNSLVYTYPGQSSPTLKGLDFHIDEGEIFGFLGPSGSGKSTTQKLLIGLLEGYEGTFSILGKDATKWGTEIYEQLGVGFELPNHFSHLSAIENLKFFASLYQTPGKQEPMALLEKVALKEDANKSVKEFSKGMKMRLNFVRALLHDPTLLFLDEPTAGLDPMNARILKDIILELKAEGKTIFLTTHNMWDADELCDRVAFINEGELVLIDSPRSLKLAHGESVVELEYREGEENKKKSFSLRGLGENDAFQKLLKEDALETIHSKEATLEDVFIKVTGRALR